MYFKFWVNQQKSNNTRFEKPSFKCKYWKIKKAECQCELAAN